MLDFYERCQFDAGVSLDHVILDFDRNMAADDVPTAWIERQQFTLVSAGSFLEEVERRNSLLIPYGAAQGWSPESYATSVSALQDMGYRHIAIGGLVPVRTPDILATLTAISEVLAPQTSLHLLGITRVDAMEQFESLGVDSFDSTSPFRQSFMDDRNNYHTLDGNYVAIRVPQSDGNPALKRRILSGAVSMRSAIACEREVLQLLAQYDLGNVDIDRVVNALAEYEDIVRPRRSYIADYKRTLADMPWKYCECDVCTDGGIQIAIFRGTERNKRRGFHNIFVFEKRIRSLRSATLEVERHSCG